MMAESVSYAIVHLSGRVQGVGFRYSTRQVAQGFEVSGTVENLMDGRVRLEIEGKKEELQAFLAELQRQMESFIKEMDEKWGQRERSLRNFVIAPTRR